MTPHTPQPEESPCELCDVHSNCAKHTKDEPEEWSVRFDEEFIEMYSGDKRKFREFLEIEIRKAEERTQHQEMARAYDMMKHHRETAKVAGALLYFTEMDKTVEYMELWAEKLGINLEKIAKDFYNDDDLEALKK